MRFLPVRSVIVAVWLGLMGWFIRYEAYPGWFTGALAGYRSILTEGEIFSDSWMLIKFKEQNLGYSHTQIEMDEKHPTQRYIITSRTMLTINLGGEKQMVNVSSETKLDPFQRLVNFKFSLSARRYGLEVSGLRHDADHFKVLVRSGAARYLTTVRIPDDVVIYSPMTMMSLGRMKPGDTAKLKTFDPMTIGKGGMAVDEVLVKALGRKMYAWGTNNTEATELAVTYHGTTMNALIDAQGQILREDTPYGWSMVATTADEALRADTTSGAEAGDLLTNLGVPVRGQIRDPDACRELKVRLSGLHFSIEEVSGARQRAEEGTNATAIVTLRAGARGDERPLLDEEREAALASTPYIQAGDPAMRRKAEEITHGLAGDHEKALAIAHWVYKSVKKSLTVSIPSALDVLSQREGDCNEHTYLFVGLARAAGLPAQVRVGIVYKDEGYFYHAWPAVYVGRWLELDPTLNYDEVGTRHITLLQGELGSQAKLMSVLGQLRVEVLEQKY